MPRQPGGGPVTPHDALRALGQRYARAADARDVTALEELFHPDAQIVGSRGAQSREEWLETMRAPRAFPTSMHLVGDPLIVLDDDEQRATMDSYAVVFQLSDAGTGHSDLTLGIRYVDDVVLDSGRWVILHRRAQTVWMR
jgi:SnoaL-like domain